MGSSRTPTDLTESTTRASADTSQLSMMAPALSPVAQSRWEAQAQTLASEANEFVCDSDEAFEYAARTVVKLRDAEKDWKSIFTPIKQWFDKSKREMALDPEQRVLTNLELAKKLFGDKAVAYKANRDRIKEEERRRIEADNARAAEESAQAASVLTTQALLEKDPTKREELMNTAEATREIGQSPVPTSVATKAPKVAGFKTAQRLEVEVVSKNDLLMAVGAALICEALEAREDFIPDFGTAVRVLRAHFAGPIKDAEMFSGALDANVAWLKREFQQRDEKTFKLPGVTAQRKEGAA